MAKRRSIEETFQAIKPRGQKGIPNPPTISVGTASTNSDFSSSLSQAGQQISQLQQVYQQQASLIQANTEALQGNTSAQGKSSAGGVAGGVASSLLGGLGLGLLSPLISGIASLFGGGSSTPAPLPVYVPPPPVSINSALYPATPNATGPIAATGSATVSPAGSAGQSAPQITAPVTAMDRLFAGSSASGSSTSTSSTSTSVPFYVPPSTLNPATPYPVAPNGTTAYVPPAVAAINASLNAATPNPATSSGTPAGAASSPAPGAASQAASAPQVTVNVNAMDSQSFMDRSTDIANAVREAMLNMHPINGVVASL